MRHFAVAALLAALTLTAPGAAHAQFAGKWSFELGTWQTEDGADIEIRSSNAGTLDVRLAGDSATAVWNAATGNSQPLEFSGRMESGKLMLKASREGRVNLNGEESTVMISITFELTQTATGLSGVMRMSGGPGPAAWRSATGKRAT